jgi:hypothetical protein
MQSGYYIGDVTAQQGFGKESCKTKDDPAGDEPAPGRGGEFLLSSPSCMVAFYVLALSAGANNWLFNLYFSHTIVHYGRLNERTLYRQQSHNR